MIDLVLILSLLDCPIYVPCGFGLFVFCGFSFVLCLWFSRDHCSSVQFRRKPLFSHLSLSLPLVSFSQNRLESLSSRILLFRSNLIYYPLAQQSTLQQPVYLAPTTAGSGTTWSTNLLSQFNLPTSTNTTVTNTGTASPQTIYELPAGLFDSSSTSTNAARQPLYWPAYN